MSEAEFNPYRPPRSGVSDGGENLREGRSQADGELVPIASLATPVEAEILKDLLTAEGIPATLGDARAAQAGVPGSTALGDVCVMVPATFLPQARALTARLRDESPTVEGRPDPALAARPAATNRALWNPDLAGLFSTALTPVFGACLLAINARELDDRMQRRLADVWLAIATIVVAAALWQTRDHEPSIWHVFEVSLLLSPCTLLWYFLGAHAQGHRIAKAHGRQYRHRRFGTAAAIAAMWMVLLGAAGF